MKMTLLASSLALALAGSANASELIIVNADGPGVGLNDATPRTPEGGNPGTTVGEQRLFAYQFAADVWGNVLQSSVPILVQGSFAALSCDATSGVLGSSGTNYIFRDFTGAPLAGTWYHSALADAISGIDLTEDEVGPDVPDLVSQFNANLGQSNCLAGSGWYYGIDGNTPDGLISFIDVVTHELAHGLGFAGFYSLTTGAPFSSYPDVFSSFVYDNVTSKSWLAMTNAERKTAAISNGLVFTGTNAVAQTALVLDEAISLQASGTLTATYGFGTADFGAPATPDNFSGSAVLVSDGTATPTLGCNPLTNAADVAGHVAIVDRGTCTFAIKSKNAQDAGATAVVLVNNVAGAPPGMTGGDATNLIPIISVALPDGNAIKAALPGVNLALAPVPGQLAGADTLGRPKLYAPTVLALGSSFSHYDTSASPNALMEPAINDSLNANINLDLTPAAFADIGWDINPDNVQLGDCDSTVPYIEDGGFIHGASFIANANLCAAVTTTQGAFYQCLKVFNQSETGTALLTHEQKYQIRTVCNTPENKKKFYDSIKN